MSPWTPLNWLAGGLAKGIGRLALAGGMALGQGAYNTSRFLLPRLPGMATSLASNAAVLGAGIGKGTLDFGSDLLGGAMGLTNSLYNLASTDYLRGGRIPLMARPLRGSSTQAAFQMSAAVQNRLVGGVTALGVGAGLWGGMKNQRSTIYAAEQNPDGSIEAVRPDMLGASGSMAFAMNRAGRGG